jgi:RNA polymerase sigma-70 factor (ECF subfamily)
VEPDELLVQRIRSGDLAAFDVLYARHEVRLFAYLGALLGDRSDAEEVLHDAFLAVLLDKNANFESSSAFRAWLYRVARNTAFNRKRASAREERRLALLGSAEPVAEHEASRSLETRELDLALANAITRLPEPMSELWHLRTSGLSYEQIAGVVGVPLGTVKSRMHQMVSLLKQELKAWIAPE